MLNNLTNFLNIIAAGMVKKTLSDTDLIAVGTKDKNYDGGYKPTAITAADLINQIGEPSVVLTQGTLEPNVQATMNPIPGKITLSDGTVFDRYRVQGLALLTGSSSYAYLIGVVVGSDTIGRVREDTTILATDTNVYDTVASAMNRNAFVSDTFGNLALVSSAFIADDNTISAPDEHWFTLVMTAGVIFSADVVIDFTIAVPQGTVIEFFN